MTSDKKTEPTTVPLFYKKSKFYPTLMAYSQLVTPVERTIWVTIYVLFYATLFILTRQKGRDLRLGILGGFLFGIGAFVVEYYQKATDRWVVFNELDGHAYSVPVDRRSPIDNNWSIYVDGGVLPESTDMGYFLDSETYDYNVTNNGFTAIPLASIYTGVFKKTVNMGSQADPVFFSAVNDYIAKNSFYIVVTVLAWGMFIIKTKWFKFIILFWILLALILSIVTGTLIGQSWDVYNSNYILQTKKILLVFSISVAITSVLIA